MTEPIFDRKCFGAFVDDIGEDTAREVLGVFLLDTEKCLGSLAVDEPSIDSKAIVIHAHSIKSSAATFGFSRLSALARQIETDAALLSVTDLLARVRELQAAFSKVRDLVTDHGKGHP